MFGKKYFYSNIFSSLIINSYLPLYIPDLGMHFACFSLNVQLVATLKIILI